MAARPTDRFDRIADEPGRVGAHRGSKRSGRGWITFGIAVAATAALVFGGLFVLSRWFEVDFGMPFLAQPTPTPTPTVTKAPPITSDPSKIDPARGITIVVLNGTPLSDLQDTIGDELAAAGWPITSRANSSDRSIRDTIVYYSSVEDEDVARGLVKVLGVGEIRQVGVDTYPGAAITIVLGMDHPLVPKPEPSATDAPSDTGSTGSSSSG